MNSAMESRLKKFLLAAGLSSLTTFSPALTFDAPSSFGQVEVPDIGGGVGLIDQQQERFIGEKVYREVHKQMPVMQNPWLEDQLYSIFVF